MSKHVVKIYITEEDIYNKLLDEDKKRFNRAITTDVEKWEDGSVTITYNLVNDCSIDLNEHYNNQQCSCKFLSEGNLVPYKEL